MKIYKETPSFFEPLREKAKWNVLSDLHQRRMDAKIIEDTFHHQLLTVVEELPDLVPSQTVWNQPFVTIGRAEDLTAEETTKLEKVLQQFMPWKKGPFSLYGIDIDSEWRSDWKWERIQKILPDLRGKRLADIGCSNGYFMFRMLEHAPEFVVGMDPFAKAYLNFLLLKKLSGVTNLDFLLCGAEHAHLFGPSFDIVFCLGVIYHHTDPMLFLRSIHQSMVKGGELIIESQGIPGDLPVALTPRRRYAQASGIWFLPTISCLKNWLERAQFRDVECFYAEPLSPEEQRRTTWADIDSLEDFLDKDDPTKTIEGYPAPLRIYMKAKK